MIKKPLLHCLFILASIALAISVTSCRKDFSTTPSVGSLIFSKDTVFLDTVFTNIGSATYSLKVYNRTSQDVSIPSIQLEQGETSKYRLNVDGIPGKAFQNIDILAKDSIYIFIETTVDITTLTNPLYTDRILFDQGIYQQDVDLVTLVQDAVFIYPGRNPVSLAIDSLTLSGEATSLKGRFLSDQELHFTGNKPYVIYGYAAVPNGKTLTIDAGAQVYFHEDSGLIIDEGASLKATGTLEDKVVFQGDRLEATFQTIPGQWGTIWLRSGSIANELNHTIIKNGTLGILVDDTTGTTPTLSIKNTEIYNHSNYGMLARASHISAENIVVGSAGQSSVAFIMGGTYNIIHSTFANYWSSSFRQFPAVLINNFLTYTDGSGAEIIEPLDLVTAEFTNCIIDGNNAIEFIADKVDGAAFNFKISHSLLKFNDPSNAYAGIEEFNFGNTNYYESLVLNGTPHFRNTSLNIFEIGQNSDAINLGNPQAASRVPTDILGIDRTSAPDLGAYQHRNF